MTETASPWWESRPLMRGVNLGGWFLLERWMQESVFAGTDARDEFDLCHAWGESASERFLQHRETYITRDDLVWLAARGINSVRIPFGYWLIDPEPPFVGGIEFLDRAVRWCEDLGLIAVLDLHGLPGCQSSEHHTGRCDLFRWPDDEACQDRTIDVLDTVAARYAQSSAVRGFEVVNEPSPRIDARTLDRYYRRAYAAIRRKMPFERVAVVFQAFPETRLRDFHGHYRFPTFENVITDLHYYQCFGYWYGRMDLKTHFGLPLSRRLPEILRQNRKGWLMVGEWSLRLPWSPTDVARNLSPFQRDLAMRAFGATQLMAYEHTQGWFFWSYKAENEPEWSFRDCVERGWLPDRFDPT